MDRIAIKTARNTKKVRTFGRVWLFGLMALVAIAAVACGSDTPSSDSLAQVAAGGSTEASEASDAAQAGESVGNAPPIVGETFEHGDFSLGLHDGKPVLVNFWFPSCPPCRAEMPDLQTAFEKYGEDVAFIGVQQLGLDSAANGEAFVRELGLTYPNMPDIESKVQFNYEVFSYPTTIFLDKNHDIAREWTGILGEEDLAKVLDGLLAG
jgi:thiol-disulfide isomerase/thioredoxin